MMSTKINVRYNRIVFFVIFLLYTQLLYSQQTDSLSLKSIYDLSLDELMNIKVVTASKRPEKISDIPASIIMITRRDIEKNGYRTLEDIFKNIPGMYTINDYLWFGTDNYGVRGFFSTGSFNDMIILVNGVNQMEEWYSSFPTTKINVPVESIDRIEVVRGPMSVIYGNSAFLGAINIITNDVSDDNQNILSVSSDINSYNRAFVRFTGKEGDLQYAFNASISNSDGIEEAYKNMMSKPEKLEDWNLSQDKTSAGQLKDDRKYFNLSTKFKDFYFDMSYNSTKRGVIDFWPGYDDGHIAEIEASNILAGYKHSFTDKITLDARFGYYSFRNRLDYKHNSYTMAYTFNDIFSEAYDFEINLLLKPSENFELIAGLYRRETTNAKLVVDAPNLSNNYVNLDAGLGRNNSKITNAIFTEINYKFSKLNFIAGLRLEQSPKYTIDYSVRYDPNNYYEYYSTQGIYLNDKINVIPRLAIIYHLAENHTFKFLYGKAIKQPSIGENMDVPRYPDRPQLEPAEMETLEFNYITTLYSNTMVNFSIFKNMVDKLISRTNTIENGVMKLFNTNSGKISTNGVEFDLNYIYNKFNFHISVTYQQSENLKDGFNNIDLGYSPNLLGYGSISYQVHSNVVINLLGRYVDEMESFWKISGSSLDPNDGERIGVKVPSYFVSDLNIRADDIFSNGIYFSLNIQNLFDTEIRYPTTTSNDIFDKGTIGMGRSLFGTVGWKF